MYLGKKLEHLEGNLLVWLSAIYGIIVIIGEIFHISQFQLLHNNPAFFVPAISLFLFLLSKYILSLSDKIHDIENVSEYLKESKEDIKYLRLTSDYLIKIAEDVKYIRSKNETTALDRYWQYCLSLVEKGEYTQEPNDKIVISKHNVPTFWRRILIKPEKTWYCTDVFKPDEKWGYTFNHYDALGFQRYAIAEGAAVRRIFIIKDYKILSTRRKEMIEMMKEHKRVGVDVKWMDYSTSSDWINLSIFEDILSTIDFAIADNMYIMACHLDENLRHTNFSFIRDHELAEKLYNYYETLWLTSKNIDELEAYTLNKT